MKRDEVMEGVARAVEYTRSHARTLMTGAAVVLLAAIVAASIYAYGESRDRKAQEALAEALEVLTIAEDSADSQGTPARDALVAVADDYSGTSAARVAQALAGALAATQGNLETAKQELEKLARGEDDLLSAQIGLNLLRIQRNLGEDQEVVSRIEEMLSSENPLLPEDILLFERAVSYRKLGDMEAARSDLQRILDEHPESSLAAEARQDLGEISES